MIVVGVPPQLAAAVAMAIELTAQRNGRMSRDLESLVAELRALAAERVLSVARSDPGTPERCDSADVRTMSPVGAVMGVKQVAGLLGVSNEAVRARCRRGSFAGAGQTGAGGAWLIPTYVAVEAAEAKKAAAVKRRGLAEESR